MRNLKKVLSLALALVMLVGMMVVGAGAATYADSASVQKGEAVDVMSGIGVFTGNDAGNFNPAGYLNRQEAAKIIATVTLGPTVANNLSVANTGFSDVPAGSWASGYIAYCANENIIVGADGKFRPYDLLEATEFAKMLLVAVGKDPAGYVGSGWNMNVQKDALSTGLTKDVTMGAWFDPITRENAAQMAFNALQYSPSGANGYTVDGSDVVFPDLITALLAAGMDATKVHVSNAADTLGSRVFGLKESAGTDAFGRATKVWTANNGMKVELAGSAATKTYTTAASATAVAKDFEGYTLALKKNSMITNGAAEADSTDASAAVTTISGASNSINYLTGNGKVVEVYANSSKQITKVVVVDYKAGALNITTAANGNVTYTVLTQTGTNFADNTPDTVVLHGAVAQGDFVTTASVGGVLHIYPTVKVSGVMTAYSTTTNTLTVNGASYVVGTSVGKDASSGKVATSDFAGFLGKSDITWFVDQNGVIVGAAGVSAPVNYAYIASVGGSVSASVDGLTPVIQARAVLADGTVGVFNLKATKAAAASGSIEVGDWTVAGIEVLDKAGTALKDGYSTSFNQKVFAYTLDGTTMTLSTVEADTAIAEGKTVVGAVTGYNGVTSKATTNSKTALFNNETVFVLFNTANNTAVAVTGPAALGGTSIGGQVVMTYAAANTGMAKIVFAEATLGAANSGNYVYINKATEFNTILNNRPVVGYIGTTADNTPMTVYKSEALAASGLYYYNTDMTVGAEVTGDNVKTGTALVVGSLISVDAGTTWYNITSATKQVIIDTTKYEANGNNVIVVLDKTNAASIFVVPAAAPAPHTCNWVQVGAQTADCDTAGGAAYYHCDDASCPNGNYSVKKANSDGSGADITWEVDPDNHDSGKTLSWAAATAGQKDDQGNNCTVGNHYQFCDKCHNAVGAGHAAGDTSGTGCDVAGGGCS